MSGGGGARVFVWPFFFISQGRRKASFSPIYMQDRLYFHYALWPVIYFTHVSHKDISKNLQVPLQYYNGGPLIFLLNIYTACVDIQSRIVFSSYLLSYLLSMLVKPEPKMHTPLPLIPRVLSFFPEPLRHFMSLYTYDFPV